MTSVTFNLDTKNAAKLAVAAIVTATVLLVFLALAFYRSYASLRLQSSADVPESGFPVLSVSPDKDIWPVFFRRRSSAQGRAGDNYRLAGTYFEFGASHNARKAILDEISSGQQHIVAEGQSVADLLVLSIASDHILVRTPSGAEEELWLSFTSGASRESADSPGSDGDEEHKASPDSADGFGGRRVGANRWIFEREKLMNYYTDLMSEPERLVKVFDSFKPMYTEEGKIEGYEIEVFGEQPFFESVGLQPGDKVQAVNSIDMTNRRRAEYLIKEFVKERVNVIVMDIERDGNAQKFIYQIR